jgi:phospholipase C
VTRRRLALGVAAAVAAGAAVPAGAAEPSPRTPIEHFVVLMQENHSFDNYFGTYPGADGIPRRTCMPVDPSAARGRCVKPFHLGTRTVQDTPLGHSTRVTRRQYNGGRMDGFVSAFGAEAGTFEPAVMGYYDARDIPYYWAVADDYVLFDRFFASSSGGTLANHMFWTAATAGPLEQGGVPPEGLRGIPTIFDRLQRAGVSWKFYVENYDPAITYRNASSAKQRAQLLRVPLLGFPRFLDDRRRFARIVDLSEYYEDLERGTLPAVAYIAPSGSSEHPPGSVAAGQKLVRTLLGALMRSSAWPGSAFMWTYDGAGGWYDHVRPPRAGLGFRVPALLVSPYARRGAVDSTPLHFAAIPRFIERNWRLAPLTARDAGARSLVRSLDFGKTARAPELPADADPAHRPDARRSVIYGVYGSALLVAALAVLGAALRSRARALPLLLAACALAGGWGAPAAQARAATLEVKTVPATAGVRIEANGQVLSTDRSGVARLAVDVPVAAGKASLHDVVDSVKVLETEVGRRAYARLGRWYAFGGWRRPAAGAYVLHAALDLSYAVRPKYVDPEGGTVDPERVAAVEVRSSYGTRHVFDGTEDLRLLGTRVARIGSRLRPRPIQYSVDRVVVDGANVVNRGQLRFHPDRARELAIGVRFYPATIVVRDALFGFAIGSAVRLRRPDGTVARYELNRDGEARLPALPRGSYEVEADALGVLSQTPIALSRRQRVELRVVSYLDLAIVLLGLSAIAALLVRGRQRPAPGASVTLPGGRAMRIVSFERRRR